MSNIIIRSFRSGDEAAFLQLQNETFRGLEYLPRVKVGLGAFDREGSFLAEKDGSVVGCVGLLKLERPGWFEIRNLAVREAGSTEIAERLLAKAIAYVDSKNPQYVKASTPAVQPFVDLYKQAGFTPVRRSLRIVWDLQAYRMGQSRIQTGDVSKDLADEAAVVWVEGLRPYWDYWIEEEGGPEACAAWVKESVGKGDRGWIGAFIDGKLVGVAILRTDYYGPGEARFNGAYALPEFRGRGIGSALMDTTVREAQERKQKTMRVYTLAFIDHLAPGSILYLKSGGKIEAEYLQLQRKNA